MSAVFWSLVVVCQLSAVAMLVSMVMWLQHHVGGFVWGAPGGYHPLLMTVSLVFLFGEAVQSFRVFSRIEGCPYLAQKAVHATIHTVIIILATAGLHAASLAKTRTSSGDEVRDGPQHDTVHNYSIHSWLGILVVVLFGLQYVAGCAYYGAERFLRQDHPLRKYYPQLHTFFGALMLALSIASCLTGLNELSILQVIGYSKGVVSGTIGNVYGLTMVLYGGLVTFITTRSQYKRKPVRVDQTIRNSGSSYQECSPGVRVEIGDVTDDGDGLRMQNQ